MAQEGDRYKKARCHTGMLLVQYHQNAYAIS